MDKVWKMLEDAADIIIYGAGSVADVLYLLLEECGISNKVKDFIVTSLNNNVEMRHGYLVKELKSYYAQIKKELIVVAVQPEIVHSIEEEIKKFRLENYVVVNSEELLTVFYEKLYQQPIQGNKILAQNAFGKGYGCNPKYIIEQLLQKGLDLDVVWAVASENDYVPNYIRKVKYGSREYYHELATARLWIDNSRKRIMDKKRKGQFYVQTWHGAAPMKMVEADAVTLPLHYVRGAQNDSVMADIFLSGSQFYTNLYKKSFWYEGEILQLGLPRQDVFWYRQKVQEKVKKYYGIGANEKIVMYAPTFRESECADCYDLDITRIKAALEKRFGFKFRFWVSRHPVNKKEYQIKKDAEFIYVGDYGDFEELLAATDVLISDYSGCVYDFSFTNRPVFLYQKDYEDYLLERQFYIDMDELPYIKAHSNEELENKILEFDYESYQVALNKFMESMGNYDNGTAAEGVADYLVKKVFS